MALRLASEATADSRLTTWMLHGVAGISLLDFILYLYRVLIDSAGCEGRVSFEGGFARNGETQLLRALRDSSLLAELLIRESCTPSS